MPIKMKCDTFHDNQRYKAGEIHTVDEIVAKRWISRGIAEAAEENPKPLEKYTLVELKIFAEEHGIALGDAQRKDDVLAMILAATEQNSANNLEE